MLAAIDPEAELPPATRAFYRRVLEVLEAARVPFLVGGAYAFARYTGIVRHTRDFDLFLAPEDVPRAIATLRRAGFESCVHSPHWLGKVFRPDCGEEFVDLIWGAGNDIARVDPLWFEHAPAGEALGVPARFCPAEEMIWSKAFIMERERCDGADVIHLLRAGAETLDWERLLARFGESWRVLLAHLVLFGYVYPTERDALPSWVMRRLLERLRDELDAPAAGPRVCRGTLLSREQYLPDVELWGYLDARLPPTGTMSAEEIELWTARIAEDGSEATQEAQAAAAALSAKDRPDR
jgi:hypothetical protein